MKDHEYEKAVEGMVKDAIALMTKAAKLMREHDDKARAMDLDEAMDYAEASIEEV